MNSRLERLLITLLTTESLYAELSMKMNLPFRLLLFVGLAFASCQKEPSPQPPVNPSATDEIVAPASFNWSMIDEVTVRI